MKRRHLILGSAGLLLPVIGRSAVPCPPSPVSVAGGTSTSTACPISSASYSTNFPLTENPISEGGKWISGGINPPRTNVQTASAHAYGTMTSFDGTNYDDSIAILSSAFPANQWAQGTLYNNGAVDLTEVELVLRGNLTATNNTGYEIDIVHSGPLVNLVSWNGPDNNFTILRGYNTGFTINDGDVFYAQIVGTVITLKCNGSTFATYDTSGDAFKVSSGSPGMGFWNQTGSSANSPKFGLKAYSAGSL